MCSNFLTGTEHERTLFSGLLLLLRVYAVTVIISKQSRLFGVALWPLCVVALIL